MTKFFAPGIDTFVCLQQVTELERFRAYADEAIVIHGDTAEKRTLTFENFQIPDHGIADDDKVVELTDRLANLIRSEPERKILIHCWVRRGRERHRSHEFLY